MEQISQLKEKIDSYQPERRNWILSLSVRLITQVLYDEQTTALLRFIRKSTGLILGIVGQFLEDQVDYFKLANRQRKILLKAQDGSIFPLSVFLLLSVVGLMEDRMDEVLFLLNRLIVPIPDEKLEKQFNQKYLKLLHPLFLPNIQLSPAQQRKTQEILLVHSPTAFRPIRTLLNLKRLLFQILSYKFFPGRQQFGPWLENMSQQNFQILALNFKIITYNQKGLQQFIQQFLPTQPLPFLQLSKGNRNALIGARQKRIKTFDDYNYLESQQEKMRFILNFLKPTGRLDRQRVPAVFQFLKKHYKIQLRKPQKMSDKQIEEQIWSVIQQRKKVQTRAQARERRHIYKIKKVDPKVQQGQLFIPSIASAVGQDALMLRNIRQDMRQVIAGRLPVGYVPVFYQIEGINIFQTNIQKIQYLYQLYKAHGKKMTVYLLLVYLEGVQLFRQTTVLIKQEQQQNNFFQQFFQDLKQFSLDYNQPFNQIIIVKVAFMVLDKTMQAQRNIIALPKKYTIARGRPTKNESQLARRNHEGPCVQGVVKILQEKGYRFNYQRQPDQWIPIYAQLLNQPQKFPGLHFFLWPLIPLQVIPGHYYMYYQVSNQHLDLLPFDYKKPLFEALPHWQPTAGKERRYLPQIQDQTKYFQDVCTNFFLRQKRIYWDIQTYCTINEQGNQELNLFSIAAVCGKHRYFGFVSEHTPQKTLLSLFINWCLNLTQTSVTIIGFNSSRFDTAYIVQSLIHQFGRAEIIGDRTSLKALTVQRDKKILRFTDLAKVTSDGSLRQWAKQMGVSQKGDYDVVGKTYAQMVNQIQEVRKYNIQDCVATRQIHQKFTFELWNVCRQLIGRHQTTLTPLSLLKKTTIPSIAFKIWSEIFGPGPQNPGLVVMRTTDPWIQERERAYVAGGMVGTHRYGVVQEQIFGFDFVGLYASVARDIPCPISLSHQPKKRTLKQILQIVKGGNLIPHYTIVFFIQIQRYTFTQQWAQGYFMVNTQHGNIFPLQGIKKIISSQQILRLLKLSQLLGKTPPRFVLGSSWGWTSLLNSHPQHLFYNFIIGCCELRQNAGKDTPKGICVKKVMNSLFGILAQKDVSPIEWFDTSLISNLNYYSDSYKRSEYCGGLIPQISQFKGKQAHKLESTYGLIRFGAFIPAMGRIKQFQIISICGQDTLYFDTDSIYTNRRGFLKLIQLVPHLLDRKSFEPLKEQFQLDFQTFGKLHERGLRNLGLLQFKGRYLGGIFMAAKSYILRIPLEQVKGKQQDSKLCIFKDYAFQINMKGINTRDLNLQQKQTLVKDCYGWTKGSFFFIPNKIIQKIWKRKMGEKVIITKIQKMLRFYPKRKARKQDERHTAPFKDIHEWKAYMDIFK